MKAVVIIFVKNVNTNQQATANANGKSEDVYKGVQLIFPDLPERNLQ
jgi:hypothetical protein